VLYCIKLNIASNTYQHEKIENFSLLRNQIEQKRATNTKHRLSINPYPTSRESMLGAFIEMYEPYLLPIVRSLMKKGYLVENTSGFCGEYFNCQTLNGFFPLDYISVNKLAKLGAKIQTDVYTKSIKFWPETANIEVIKKKYKQIVDTLPQRDDPPQPFQSPQAREFRRTYIPKNIKLKQHRLFEILKFNMQQKMSTDIKKRLSKNSIPNAMELKLGVFIEMIEPHLREAIMMLQAKGYTTDASGFIDKADFQNIDGDFTIGKLIIGMLKEEGVIVETNHSGYTRLQFMPSVANIKSIKDKWMKIVSLFPDKGKASDPSMTRRAREFRIKYSS